MPDELYCGERVLACKEFMEPDRPCIYGVEAQADHRFRCRRARLVAYWMPAEEVNGITAMRPYEGCFLQLQVPSPETGLFSLPS